MFSYNLSRVFLLSIIGATLLPFAWGAGSMRLDIVRFTEEWYKGVVSLAQLYIGTIVLDKLFRMSGETRVLSQALQAAQERSEAIEEVEGWISGLNTITHRRIQSEEFARCASLCRELKRVDFRSLRSSEQSQAKILAKCAPYFQHLSEVLIDSKFHGTNDKDALASAKFLTSSMGDVFSSPQRVYPLGA